MLPFSSLQNLLSISIFNLWSIVLIVIFHFWTVVNLTLVDLPGLTKVAVGKKHLLFLLFVFTYVKDLKFYYDLHIKTLFPYMHLWQWVSKNCKPSGIFFFWMWWSMFILNLISLVVVAYCQFGAWLFFTNDSCIQFPFSWFLLLI